MRDVDYLLAAAPDLARFTSNFGSEPFKMFYAYPYPRGGKDASEAEKAFRRSLFNFKDNKNGGASQQIKDAFANRVKKAVLWLGTIENVIVVNMPSSAGPAATKSRWSDVNEMLQGGECRLQVLDSDKCFFSRPRPESYAKNTLADRKADQDVIKDLVINAEQDIFGKHVIILDDVITTGCHIRQLGDALRANGASSVTCVALCCTDPQAQHTDTRYRFNIEHDEYCRRHRAGFKTSLDPLEDQALFAKLYYKERPQMELLEDPLPLKRDPVRIKFSHNHYDGSSADTSMAAENTTNITSYNTSTRDISKKEISRKEISKKEIMTKTEEAQPSAQVQTEQKKSTVAKTAQVKSTQVKTTQVKGTQAKATQEPVKQEPVQQEQVKQEPVKKEPAKKEIDLPKEIKVAYASVSPIISTSGEKISVNDPRFATTIRLGDLNKLPSTLVTDKTGKQHHIIDFAIVPNKKYVEGKTSPYLVIVKRHDAPAVYGGADMKYVDKDAVLEFSLNRSQVFGKASSLNLRLDDTIQLHIGKTGAGSTGVTLNPAEYKNADKKSLELSARVSVVNSFDRTLKASYNMDKIGEHRYIDKFLGSAFGYQPKENGMPLINQYNNMPITNFNFKLNRDDIRFLPEADRFGNVSIAIVRRDLTPERLQEKGLHMEAGCDYPVNERGIKQPNYHVIADPKIYKGGEPNVNVVAVMKLNRSELASLPYTSESFATRDGRQVSNSYIHLSTDKFGNVKVNTKEYDFHQVVANEQKLTSKTTVYSDEINQRERQLWDYSHPRLSQEAFEAKVEMEKTMPTQFDNYRAAVKALNPQISQNQTAQNQTAQDLAPHQETVESVHTQQASARENIGNGNTASGNIGRDYKDYSQPDYSEYEDPSLSQSFSPTHLPF